MGRSAVNIPDGRRLVGKQMQPGAGYVDGRVASYGSFNPPSIPAGGWSAWVDINTFSTPGFILGITGVKTSLAVAMAVAVGVGPAGSEVTVLEHGVVPPASATSYNIIFPVPCAFNANQRVAIRFGATAAGTWTTTLGPWFLYANSLMLEGT